ncbi:hypothetical protein AZH45_04510 [Corynebacterium striatum]|nr:hypothetical protein AZH45_04510 [Corynebacterium striatum]
MRRNLFTIELLIVWLFNRLFLVQSYLACGVRAALIPSFIKRGDKVRTVCCAVIVALSTANHAATLAGLNHFNQLLAAY